MLDICSSFFQYLNLHDIRYCHWKSNSHLEEALNGKTDIDFLVHYDDKERFKKAMKKFLLKRILSPREKRFPGIEDYLGFDEKTGKLIHLHVYYRLVMGQKFIKNHHLPIEEVIFNNLIKRDEIFIPCPEAELILLIIRAHMKVGIIPLFKQVINDVLGKTSTPFPKAIEREFVSLIGSSSLKKMTNILHQFKLPLSEDLFIHFINRFSEKRLKCHNILSAMLHIFSSLREYRRQKSILVYFKYSYLSIRNLPYIRRFVKENKKTLAGRGKIFSFIGADGSGKSTIVKDIEKWFSWKLSIITYYHGIPKTVLKNFIPFSIRWLNNLWMKPVASLLRYFYIVYLAKRKYEISQISSRDILSGKIVLTDRFPLKDFQDMSEPMDGPQLLQCSTKIGGFFSKIESNYYNRIAYPDRIFILQADIAELRRRKDNLPLETHKMKAGAVNALRGNGQIILIDANKPYSDVQLEVKRKIWEIL